MSTCKITYNGNEISAVDETAPVSVAYNSATIATLNDGDTKTLDCHGKVMASDVVVGSKTLNCNGKLMQGNIVVELVGSATSGETWYFNDTIGYPETNPLDVNFTSLNVAFTRMYRHKSFTFIDELQYTESTDKRIAAYNYKSSAWADIGFRTIVLDEPATGGVLELLEDNATKLSERMTEVT